MAVPMEGWTESNGSPDVYYRYELSTSNRTASTVHVVLRLSLRLRYYSSYYSFRVAHECTVNGVYQYRDIKTDRSFWGHQWEGTYLEGSFGWVYGTYDYDGTAWHGPYTVFEGDVPMGLDETALHVVPCVTQPPITGLGGTGLYAPNPQDVTNWAGQWGYWRPFGEDEMVGSYTPWNLGYPCPSDGPFLNNRGLQELSGPGVDIGPYGRPDSPKSATATPSRIDVAQASTTPVSVSWPSTGSPTYLVEMNFGDEVREVSRTSSPSLKVLPGKVLGRAMAAGDSVSFSVTPVDSNGVAATSPARTGDVVYFEVGSTPPSDVDLLTSRPDAVVGGALCKQVSFRGERCVFLYRGGTDGSYPASRYVLELDGSQVASWRAQDASQTAHGGLRWSSVQVSLPGGEAGSKGVLALYAYDSAGRLLEPVPTLDVYRYGTDAHVWDGSKFREGYSVHVWDGSSWLEASRPYVWDGKKWRTGR